MSYPTCRRHPRTTLEAFTRTTEYASAIERPIRPRLYRVCRACICLAVFALIGALLAYRG